MLFPRLQPCLLHSQTKRVLLGKSIRSTLPGPLKVFSVCVIFLPLSNECAVSPGRIQAFTDRKDRRNACTYKICLVKFPASTSSFVLELSQSGSVRVQGPDTGSCGKSRDFWLSTPSPNTIGNPSPELCFSCPCLPFPDSWWDLTVCPALKELCMKNLQTDCVNWPCNCRNGLIGQFSEEKIVRRNVYSMRSGSCMCCSCHTVKFCVFFSLPE